MPKTATIRARVEPELKHEAEAMLEELGLSPTTAITLFYRQVVRQRGLPLELRVPNAETRAAMLDARAGEGVTRSASVEDFFAQLDAEENRGPDSPESAESRMSAPGGA